MQKGNGVIALDIPGVGSFAWEHLVLDVNGTLSLDGALVPGVRERLDELSTRLTVHLLTADTRGAAEEIARHLGVGWAKVERGREAQQKRTAVESLGSEAVVAIGNGNNDALMLSAASLGIAVLGGEGTAVKALMAADILARDINEALDLLRDTTRLLASLRC